ncbi:hypothetical protein HYW44_01805 [Candidatus Daviesbacteria bacterium]|nr:hypothetical protein [Candidatus Daviesbacteria bacterium]
MNKDAKLDIPINLLTGRENGVKLAHAYRKAISGLFSEEAMPIFLHMARNQGEIPEGTDFGRINSYFLHTVGKLHGFPSSASTDRLRDHWGAALNGAYHLASYAIEAAIPHGFGYRDQDTELYNRSTLPERILRALAYHHRRDFQIETRRQFALAIVVGDFMAFNSSAGLRDRNEEIGELLDKELFASRGVQHDYRTYGYFDSATNEFVGDSDDRKPPDAFTDVKEISRKARFIEDIGSVYFHPRIKDFSRSGIKALIESIANGDTLQTIHVVPDQFGSIVTVLEGGEEEAGIVMDRSIEIFKRQFPGVKVIRKDTVKHTRGQSKLVETLMPMRRTLFEFPDLPKEATYELIARSLRSEMNGQYMNGIVDPSTGRRTGPGHKHYELDSIAGPVADVLFPVDLYTMNRVHAFAVQSSRIAERLRDSEEDPIIHFGGIRDGGYFYQGNYIVTEKQDGTTGGFYMILDEGPLRFTLRRQDGTEFLAGRASVIGHGFVGSERIIGSVKKLM